MRKKTKRIIAFSMAVLLGTSLLPADMNTAQAAKKVSVSISKSKVNVNKKVTLSVKNLPKKAKITVSSSKVKCVSFAKKKAVKKKTWVVKNGGTKKITVYAKKKGNADLKVVVKNRKGKKLLSKTISMKVTKLITKEDSDTEVIDLSKSTPSADAAETKAPEPTKTPVTADTERTPKPAEVTQATPKVSTEQPKATASPEPKKTASPGGSGNSGSGTGSDSGNSTGYEPQYYPSSENQTNQTNQSKDFSLSPEKTELLPGEEMSVTVKFKSSTNKTSDLMWSSDQNSVAAVVSADGTVHALTPGTAKITAKLKGTSVAHSFTVKVKAADVKETVENITALQTKLEESQNEENKSKNVLITYDTQETGDESEGIKIPVGNYPNVILFVKAPKATITNEASFKQIVVEELKKDTWVERSGNHLYFNAKDSHVIFQGTDTPCLTVLGGAKSVTVENEGNLQELLIASAAKIVVKGNDIAKRVKVYDYANGSEITTYVPLDIKATQSFSLEVGPGGTMTAISVSSEADIPKVSGLGTFNIKIEETGTQKSVVAEQAKDPQALMEGAGDSVVTKGNVQGNIVPENNGDVINAEVYLVPYTLEKTGKKVDVSLDKNGVISVTVSKDRSYAFENVLFGNYTLVVKATGYDLITQIIQLTSASYTVENIQLLKNTGTPGSIEGTILDASTGSMLETVVAVVLRKGMNNITTDEVQRVQTTNGKFNFQNVVPGQYTVQVVDEKMGYISSNKSVGVMQGGKSTVEVTLSKMMDKDAVRFVLTWGDGTKGESKDLDLHVYVPDIYYGSEDHVYLDSRRERNYSYDTGRWGESEVSLDVDDKEYSGPETVTVKNPEKGLYKIFVKDYTNLSEDSLYHSSPVVKIYAGSTLLYTANMTTGTGNVWYAGDFDGTDRSFYPVNEVGNNDLNNSKKAQIGSHFNRIRQFSVIKQEKFQTYQEKLKEVEEKYRSEMNEEKLEEYRATVKDTVYKMYEALTLTSLKYKDGENFLENSGYFKSSHYVSLYSSDQEIKSEQFQAAFKENYAGTVRVEKRPVLSDDSEYVNIPSYVLYLESETLGISTKYFMYVSKPTIQWVKSIKNDDDKLWYVRRNTQSAYVGGSADKLPDGVVELVELGDGVTQESVESGTLENYEKANYGTKASLTILNLKKGSETCAYKIYYIPQGAEIFEVCDEGNVLLKQRDADAFLDWTNKNRTYHIIGENATLGTNWSAVVDSAGGFQFEKGTVEEGAGYDAVGVVTGTNGAERRYNMYYHQRPKDCEILGITDDGNIFSSFSQTVNYSEKKAWGVIKLSGRNSVLGNHLKIHTLGGDVKIDYTPTEDDYAGYSDAHVTVTSKKNGAKFDYYISYSKMSGSTHIRSVQSKENANTFYQTLLGDYELSIMGSGTEVGNLDVVTDTGYEATVESGALKVRNKNSGEIEKSYVISYRQDDSGAELSGISDTNNQMKGIDISNERYRIYNRKTEQYEWVYRCFVVGKDSTLGTNETLQFKTFDKDAKVGTPISLTAEDWPYSEGVGEEHVNGFYYNFSKDSASRVEITAPNGAKRIYLIYYADSWVKELI